MKCIKVGNKIASLENILEVCERDNTTVRIKYKDGHVIGTSSVFIHQTVDVSTVDTKKTIQEIFEILLGAD